MKDMLLVLAALVVFVIGYFITRRVDRFVDRNKRNEKSPMDKKTFL